MNRIETRTRKSEQGQDTRLLRDEELDAVSGGKVTHSDFVVKKLVDASTPLLFP